jgi:hypothetical protein
MLAPGAALNESADEAAYRSVDVKVGTYGFDAKTGTAWAIINYTSKFAVASITQ